MNGSVRLDRCLCFEVVLGLRINLAKSKLDPVGNVINVVRHVAG
jgi:hypothetical protein